MPNDVVEFPVVRRKELPRVGLEAPGVSGLRVRPALAPGEAPRPHQAVEALVRVEEELVLSADDVLEAQERFHFGNLKRFLYFCSVLYWKQ